MRPQSVAIALSATLAAVLLFFALLVLPAYALSMFVWLHIPALDLLATVSPVAAASLALALVFLKLADRAAKRVDGS